ncbi:PREDICTED: uncharacterized protein LOC101304607 [Fragaria vesca subsp. vesca]
MSMSKRLKEEEEQEERLSIGLPDDILQSIPQRLCISDFQAFRQVCPNWGAAVNRGIATKTCFPAPQLPWLLLRKAYDSLHAFSIENQFSCVRDPNIFPSIKIADSPPDPPNLDDESIDMNSLGFLPNASLVCVGSIGSWLIVAAHQRCENQNSTTVINFFLNPVSHVRVMLPPQSTLEASSEFSNNILQSTFLFKKMVASSPPGLQEEDCVVAAITRPGNDLAFCRPSDAEWTLIPDFPRCTDIEIFDGKLGAVTEGNMMLMVFDMAPEDANVTRAHRLLGFCPVPFPYVLVNTEWRYPCLAKDYESKEVFLVLRKKNIKEGFKVYKTNDKVDHPDGMRWHLVTDLGDRTLFLSKQSNRVINDKTLGRNCIYFAFMSGFGVYSLKDSTVKPLHFPEDCSATTSNGGNSQSLWFTPYPC